MNSINTYNYIDSLMNFNANSNITKLRYHLAVEGCIDSQLSLAKSFLQEATNSETEKSENAELAVRWLLLANSEGNKEAQVLLENCYNLGVGITTHTRSEVEACLNSTPAEKLAQRIGNRLFRLIAYDADEPIPIEYFQQRIYQYLNNHDTTVEYDLISHKNISTVTCLSVKDVVTEVHKCLIGENPSILLNNVNYMDQIFHEEREHKLVRIIQNCYKMCIHL